MYIQLSGEKMHFQTMKLAFLMPDSIKLHSQTRQLRGKQFTSCSLNNSSSLCMLNNNSYGGERYEKRDLQIRVRKRFAELQALDEEQGRVPWHVVDASQSIEDVTKEIASIVTDTVERIAKDSSPLRRMWEDGEYELPECKAEEKKDGLN